MVTVHAPIGVLLGGIFAVAGASKLLHREQFAQALAGYRLARPPRAFAWVVPALEIAVGAALIAGLPAAGWIALAMLAVFSAALTVELVSGSAPPACGCLPGSSRPPGPLSLVRNAALGAVAVGAGLGLQVTLGETFWRLSYVILWLAVAVLAALVLALYRQVGVLHLRLGPGFAYEHEDEGPPLGEPAPDGRAGRLLVFTSRDCPICAQIVPGLRPLERDGPDRHREFLVPGTPFAVYVDPGGYVRAKGTVNTLEQLEGIVVGGRMREQELLVGGRAA
jgi:hypothetical protein